MSAMRLRMNKACAPLRADVPFLIKAQGHSRKTHGSYRQVVQACLLHTVETWSWTKGQADTLRGFEGRFPESVEARKVVGRIKSNFPQTKFQQHAGVSIKELATIWTVRVFGELDAHTGVSARVVQVAQLHANPFRICMTGATAHSLDA